MKTKTAIISIQDLRADVLPDLRRVFSAVPGVESVDFGLERGVAVVEFDPAQSNVDTLMRAALKAGYKIF
jgi:copper chaperone CopZ